MRFSAVCASNASACAAPSTALGCSGQRIAPGATPLTLTDGPSSTASARVIIASPAFAIVYTA